jgi:hypothetical protein
LESLQVLNNPLKYTDPTGHCAVGTDEEESCKQVANTFQDLWGITIVAVEKWKLNELVLMFIAITDLLRVANWSNETLKKALNGDKDQYRTYLHRVKDEGLGYAKFDGYNNNVYIENDGFHGTGLLAKMTLVHEMGHVIDWRAGLVFSETMKSKTGSYYECLDLFCWNKRWVAKGQVATWYAGWEHGSAQEDWAEALAAMVYPEAALLPQSDPAYVYPEFFGDGGKVRRDSITDFFEIIRGKP